MYDENVTSACACQQASAGSDGAREKPSVTAVWKALYKKYKTQIFGF